MNRATKQGKLNRREALRRGTFGSLGVSLFANQIALPTVIAANAGSADELGPLQAADENGLRLPLGFTSRVVATTGEVVTNSSYQWHGSPDGGATFATGDGGWVYVSNAERSSGNGGVGAIKFSNDGTIVDSYSILTGTNRNCAGGPTPWGTWLSCEETSSGEVWECDPFNASEGVVRPFLGKFQHEAAAVDPVNQHIYLTEDKSDGLLYRFVPDNYPNLTAGELQAAEILDPNGEGDIAPGQVRNLDWHTIPDPTRTNGTSTRFQIANVSRFNGGEGCWYESGEMVFSTKGDNRIWRLDIAANELSIIYDRATSSNPILSGVDNVFIAPNGDVYVSEDPGDLQIVALTEQGSVVPIMQLEGVTGTEICGPALSPDGSRLYFSSQRNPGKTYEVSGPWLGPASPIGGSSVPWMGAAGATILGALFAAYGARASGNKK